MNPDLLKCEYCGSDENEKAIIAVSGYDTCIGCLEAKLERYDRRVQALKALVIDFQQTVTFVGDYLSKIKAEDIWEI